jgi:hypothetical protein
MVQTLLGLVPLAPIETLVFDPLLPEWIPEIVVRNLRVGAARVTVRFWREDDGRSKWEVVHKTGTLHLLRQPPVESLTASPGDRVSAAFESLIR